MGKASVEKVKIDLLAVLAALFVFAGFVSVCYYFSAAQRSSGFALIIKTPEDIYNGLKVSLAALTASAMGAFIYRRPSARPAIFALAMGLVFLNFDPASLWEQVSTLVCQPSAPTAEEMSKLAHLGTYRIEQWQQLSMMADTERARIYWIYYNGYILWALVVLYSGYLGHYLVELALSKDRRSRRESSLYVAETAGFGLFANIAMGLAAVALAVAFIAAATGPGQASGVGKASGAGLSQIQRLRTYWLIVALAFLSLSYISAILIKPRTSTWVACGAIIAVMALPLAAITYSVNPEQLVRTLRILELPPFTLAGTAVAAGVAGDWAGRYIIKRGWNDDSRQTLRPL